MELGCPGASFIKTPTLEIIKCKCGEEVELFSNEPYTKCPHCKRIIIKKQRSCIDWCKYAKECIGIETYNKLKKTKVE